LPALKVGRVGSTTARIEREGDPVRRAARRAEKTERVADEAAFEHASRHADLESLLEDHMLDSDGPTATSGWLPSRRGNSPRGNASRKT
jgi:hypothetical protein